MSTIAFWLIIGATATAFIYELSTAYRRAPVARCHHCGHLRDVCVDATETVGEPCCHDCGLIMYDVDSRAPICPHDSATWRSH